MGIVLTCKDLQFTYRNSASGMQVGPISFVLKEGESFGIVGESGSGKTSLSHLLCRFITPDQGNLSLQGRSYEEFSTKEFYETIQYIDQHPHASFHPARSVYSSLMEVCDHFDQATTKAEKEKAVEEVLEAVHLNRQLVQQKPQFLSGGECQRAAIARALLIKPRILVCDEMTSALDMTIQAELMRLMKQLKDRYQMSFVFISHDLALVSQFCQQILVLKDGQVKEMGRTSDCLSAPQNPYTQELLDTYQRQERWLNKCFD